MAIKKNRRERLYTPKTKKEALDKHFINLAKAKKMIQAAGSQQPVHYHAAAIQALLDTSGCKALRIYKAKEEDGADTFVIIAVNDFYDDLPLKRKKTKKGIAKVSRGDEEGALDMGQTCPSGYSGGEEEQVKVILPQLLSNS
jgi:hypothetical protein